MNIPKIQVPIKIDPCPINEAVVELRFDSAVPEETISGLIYSKFKEDFPQFTKLPILDIPSKLREQEDLKYNPHYRLTNSGFILQIGPRSISVVCQKDYQGWSKFKGKVLKVFQGCEELGLFKNVVRLGLRYINVFPEINIFERTKMNIQFAGDSIDDHQNVLRTEFNHEKYIVIIHALNSAKIQQDKTGSLLDIDLVYSQPDILEKLDSIIEDAHDIEKRLFFGLLNDDFLKEFNPVME